MTAIQLKTPLPEGKRTVLIIMDRVARLTNLQYFVVGATARDVLMYHLHGFPLNRASPDIDFAMAIESWPAFEALRAALLQEQTFRPDAKIQHRLHYSPAVGDGFPVDLVPFGGVEISPSQVAWPPDMAVVMNVAGYAEALDSAVMYSFRAGLQTTLNATLGAADEPIPTGNLPSMGEASRSSESV